MQLESVRRLDCVRPKYVTAIFIENSIDHQVCESTLLRLLRVEGGAVWVPRCLRTRVDCACQRPEVRCEASTRFVPASIAFANFSVM